MRRIALVNQKGGVGKSTTAVNLSAGLARLGKRVLLIDLDPQAHATVALGLDPRKLEKTVYSLLAGTAFLSEVIQPVSEGLSLIPANIHLAGGEAELSSMQNQSFVLKRALADLDESRYDYAIIDSPPQLGFLNVNSLAWVREVFIPVTCEFYALHGLSLLMETVARIREKLNPLLQISGVITCQVHPRRAITRDVLAELERHFPGRVLKTRIRVNVRLVEAPSHGKPIFDYAPDSNGAADYMSLAQELIATESAPVPEPAVAAPVEDPAPAPIEAPVAILDPEPVAEGPYVPVEATPEPASETGVVPEPSSAPSGEGVSEDKLEPVAETPYVAMEPEAPLTTPVAAPEPVAETPYVSLEPGVPLTTPVDKPQAAPAPGAPGSSSTYAQMLGLAGLKPIVVAKPAPPAYPLPEKEKETFGRRLLGKLIGRKD